MILAVFLLTIVGITCGNLDFLPKMLSHIMPKNMFGAIHLAFTLILVMEIISLIFSIADSVSYAVGKQLEIMALIMLRDCFTDISLFDVHAAAESNYMPLLRIGATAVSGLLLFIFRAIFTRLHSSYGYQNMQGYVNAKKCVSFFLLVFFILTGGYDIYNVSVLGKQVTFVQSFYTALIFTDIFIVLVSQHYIQSFHATFRYSGYAVSALLMRIALGSSHYTGAFLCAFAGCYILALTWATQRFQEHKPSVSRP